MYFGLTVVPIQVLSDRSIYYLGTWTLRVPLAEALGGFITTVLVRLHASTRHVGRFFFLGQPLR